MKSLENLLARPLLKRRYHTILFNTPHRTFNSLPPEIYLELFSQTSIDLKIISLLSKKFRKLVVPYLFRAIVLNSDKAEDFGSFWESRIGSDVRSWVRRVRLNVSLGLDLELAETLKIKLEEIIATSPNFHSLHLHILQSSTSEDQALSNSFLCHLSAAASRRVKTLELSTALYDRWDSRLLTTVLEILEEFSSSLERSVLNLQHWSISTLVIDDSLDENLTRNLQNLSEFPNLKYLSLPASFFDLIQPKLVEKFKNIKTLEVKERLSYHSYYRVFKPFNLENFLLSISKMNSLSKVIISGINLSRKYHRSKGLENAWNQFEDIKLDYLKLEDLGLATVGEGDVTAEDTNEAAAQELILLISKSTECRISVDSEHSEDEAMVHLFLPSLLTFFEQKVSSIPPRLRFLSLKRTLYLSRSLFIPSRSSSSCQQRHTPLCDSYHLQELSFEKASQRILEQLEKRFGMVGISLRMFYIEGLVRKVIDEETNSWNRFGTTWGRDEVRRCRSRWWFENRWGKGVS